MKNIYFSVRGTSNFSPPQTYLFNKIVETSKNIFKLFGYEEIILPILEEEAVFVRSVGQATDIIEKQMFKVTRNRPDLDSKMQIVLRPEGTAQVIRYYIENSLYKKSDFYKFCYFGPMFRGEKPQKGRLRQFHHIGAEAIGSYSEFLDAEVIFLSLEILDALGIKQKSLHLNSLGCGLDKEKFKELLKKEILPYKDKLCIDCQRRMEKNPLRIFDCKEENCQSICEKFSSITSQQYLCKTCHSHFKNLVDILKDNFGIQPFVDFRLVRGLDYYTNTIFEINSPFLGSQNALGGGGRYNNLVEELGGPKVGAVGFALGLERIMLLLEKIDILKTIDVFIATTNDTLIKEAVKLLISLRKENISSDIDYCKKSLKGQLRYAEKKNVNFVIILGEEELKENKVILKDMKRSLQEKVNIDNIIPLLKSKLKNV
ncbi:MAG: histidine--tRNA ligase [Candidatus Omnitrophica bacterium]|nr:histidine--tRNA ligase [Candidatus Omnitrophota bacterium]